jgi:hypothetical protein
MDRAYPEQATALYLVQAQNAFLIFKSSGIFRALHSLYEGRDWRGFLVPSLGFPALVLTDGKVQLAHSLTSLCLFLPLLAYVFLILRDFLDDRRAALGTILIGSIPWVQQAAHDFNSEMPMVSCIAAVCYYGLRFRKLDSVGHALAFGAWLALGCLIRPAEMFLVFALPLLIWSVQSVRTGALRIRDLVAPSLQFAAFVYFIWKRATPNPSWMLTFFGPSFFLLIFGGRLGLRKIFVGAFQVFYLPVVAWYLPASSNLYNWLYGCSFGPNAQTTGALLGSISSARFLLTVLGLVGGWPLLGLMIVAAVFVYRERPRVLPILLAYVPWMIFPALTLGAMSPNNDPRYYIDVGLVMWLATTTVLLGDSCRFQRTRVVTVTAACVLFFWVALVTLFDPNLKTVPEALAQKVFPDYFVYSKLWGYKRVLVQSQEPWLRVVHEIEKMAPNDFERVDVLYFCHLIFDSHKANVITHEDGRAWVFIPGDSPDVSAQPYQLVNYLATHPKVLVVSCPPNQENYPIATWLYQQDNSEQKDEDFKRAGLIRLGEISWDGLPQNTLNVYRNPKN